MKKNVLPLVDGGPRDLRCVWNIDGCVIGRRGLRIKSSTVNIRGTVDIGGVEGTAFQSDESAKQSSSQILK